MPTPHAHQFLSDVLDILDSHVDPSTLHPHLIQASNVLRVALGKTPHPQPAARNATVTPAVTYFTANTAVNPPTVSVPASGSTVTFTGSPTFVDGGYTIPANSGVTFTYSQNAFQDEFYPVSLLLTGSAAAGTTISLTVNQIPILLPTYPMEQAISTTANKFEIFVPSPVFLGGINTFELQVTNNSLFVSKIEVVSALDTGDVDATINALTQTLARLGQENGKITTTWNNIVNGLGSQTPELANFRIMATVLRAAWGTLCQNMKTSAIELKAFCNNFNDVIVPTIIDPLVSRDDKLALIASAQLSAQAAQQHTINSVNSFTNFKNTVSNFQSQLQSYATTASPQLANQLNSISLQIATARLELADLQNKFNLATIGIGASFFAGAVGMWAGLAFLGPFGILVGIGAAVVATVAIGVSIGYTKSLGSQINQKQSQIIALEKTQHDLTLQAQAVQQALTDATNLSGSYVQAAQFSQAFKDMWGYINTQFMGMNSQFNQFPTQNNPALFNRYVTYWRTQMEPYFDRIDAVLDAYINNF